MTDSHQDQINRLYDVIEKRDAEIVKRDAEIKRRGECMNRLFNFVDQYAANHYYPEWRDWFDNNGRVRSWEDE